MEADDTRALDRVAVLACAALVAVAVVPAAVAPLWDADVWWILRAGRDMLAEGELPRHNRYGFTAAQHPWVMHEWGFGLLYAALARSGLGALAFARIAAVCAVAGCSAWRAFRDARPRVASLCVAMTFAVFGGRFESPRPLGLTCALACALAALVFEPDFAWRHGLCAVAVVLAWTNLHGSFPLGVLFVALGLAVPGGDRRARGWTLALACAATLVNPYGLALHGLALRYALGLGGDAVAVVHERIVEWWPLWRDPLRVASVPELVTGVGLVALWCVSLRDPRWRARAVAGLALAAMAIQHSRHLQLAGVVGASLAAGPIESLLARGGWVPRSAPRRVMALCVAAPTLFGLALWCVVARTRSEGAWVDASAQDEGARALIESLPAGSRVFVELPFTGYAVFLGAPRVTVFFDTRNDCYPASVLRLAMDVNDGLLGPAEALRGLRAYGTTHCLVRCSSRATRSLPRELRTAERDGVCLYDLRSGPVVTAVRTCRRGPRCTRSRCTTP